MPDLDLAYLSDLTGYWPVRVLTSAQVTALTTLDDRPTGADIFSTTNINVGIPASPTVGVLETWRGSYLNRSWQRWTSDGGRMWTRSTLDGITWGDWARV